MPAKKTQKICEKGHEFYKSSDCPVCPICEEIRKPKDHFLSLIAAPARRALERENIKSLQVLSQYTEKELLVLHGMGKSTIPKLKQLLEQEGMSFKR